MASYLLLFSYQLAHPAKALKAKGSKAQKDKLCAQDHTMWANQDARIRTQGSIHLSPLDNHGIIMNSTYNHQWHKCLLSYVLVATTIQNT